MNKETQIRNPKLETNSNDGRVKGSKRRSGSGFDHWLAFGNLILFRISSFGFLISRRARVFLAARRPTLCILSLALGVFLPSLPAQTPVPTNAPATTTGLGPQVDALTGFLAQGSNWMAAPYGIAYHDALGKTRFGGGVGIGYRISDYVIPTMRLDFLDRQFYMPSGSLQLQLPIHIGKFTVIPLAFSGIASPIGGRQNGNGAVGGIFGTGAAIQLGKKFDIIADMEKWTSFSGNQYRLGFVYKF